MHTPQLPAARHFRRRLSSIPASLASPIFVLSTVFALPAASTCAPPAPR